MTHLGKFLRDQRRSSGLTQAEVAEHMNVSASRIAVIEKQDMVHLKTIAKFLRSLGRDPAFVISIGAESFKIDIPNTD